MGLGNPNSQREQPIAVLGAGPAGLAAAHALVRRERPVVVLEAEDTVGGIARTVERDGYRFDLGGHRFFTKSEEIAALWDDVLGEEMLIRPRLSRIRWRGRFVNYPLSPGDVVRKIGPIEVVRCWLSYVAALPARRRDAESFEEWVSARFGRRLFELFFRSYTEKVWGVPCSEIRAEWAAQRIRGLSLGRAAFAALGGTPRADVRSLVEEFRYPRRGPGQMWEAMAADIVAGGGEVRLGTPVTGLRLAGGEVAAVRTVDEEIPVAGVVSSLPIGATAAISAPEPPRAVRAAGAGLRHRAFLTVALVVRGPDPFPDTWIYVHEHGVEVGRIQNFRAWSPAMVPDPDRACVGLEYFCFEGDALWSRPDDALVAQAARELERLGLAAAADVERGYVTRVPRAYPIYDECYAEHLDTLRAWLAGIRNLEQVGRNGLHRYNNADHSMLTGLRAVENLLDDAGHDIWAVNADGAYHEEHGPDEHPYRAAPEAAPATVALGEAAP